MYIKKNLKNLGKIVILILYIDDMLIMGNSLEGVITTKKHLASWFRMKDLGEVQSFLKLWIFRISLTANTLHSCWRNSSWWSVKAYLHQWKLGKGVQILSQVAFWSCREKMRKDNLYLQLVSALMYLVMCIHSGICFATVYLAQLNHSYMREHWLKAKRILWYLSSTKNLGIMYSAASTDP